MPRYHGIARDTKGNSVPNPLVFVYAAGTSTLSTIYEDEDFATVASNPYQGDSDGTYEFYVAPGIYKLKIEVSDYDDFEEDDVVIGIYADAYSVTAANSGILIGTNRIFYHTTTPEGVITAPAGSICLVNASGTGSMYRKTSGAGNTGWEAV
jgi:hypothetical protein